MRAGIVEPNDAVEGSCRRRTSRTSQAASRASPSISRRGGTRSAARPSCCSSPPPAWRPAPSSGTSVCAASPNARERREHQPHQAAPRPQPRHRSLVHRLQPVARSAEGVLGPGDPLLTLHRRTLLAPSQHDDHALDGGHRPRRIGHAGAEREEQVRLVAVDPPRQLRPRIHLELEVQGAQLSADPHAKKWYRKVISKSVGAGGRARRRLLRPRPLLR